MMKLLPNNRYFSIFAIEQYFLNLHQGQLTLLTAREKIKTNEHAKKNN